MRSLIAGSVICSLLAALTSGAGAQTTGRAAEVEAALVERMLEELPILRGLNEVGFTREQGTELLRLVTDHNTWVLGVRKPNTPRLKDLALSGRKELPRVLKEPELELSLDLTQRRLLSDETGKITAERRKSATAIIKFLQSLTPEQTERLMGVAREKLLEQRLYATTLGGFTPIDQLQRELERMRTLPPQEYQRSRDWTAFRMGGGMNPGTMRGFIEQRAASGDRTRPDRPPQVSDPALRSRIENAGQILDQVRTMSPAVFERRKRELAVQLSRESQIARVRAASPEELYEVFVDQYVLHERSHGALKARFVGVE